MRSGTSGIATGFRSVHPCPHPLSALEPDAIRQQLRSSRLGKEIRSFEEVGSTNTLATDWAADGAPEGALVVADHQTAGKGRLGRVWTDEVGRNLLFSVVLRPQIPAERLGIITLAAGVAVADTVAMFAAPRTPRLKWPNDVLLGNRKLAGILCESVLDAGNDHRLIVGIGVNVNQNRFPGDVATTGTSMLLECGRYFPRAVLLAEILARLEERYDQVTRGEDVQVLAAFEALMDGIGGHAVVRSAYNGKATEGTVLGVARNGALRLMTANGVQELHAGDVTLSPTSPDHL